MQNKIILTEKEEKVFKTIKNFASSLKIETNPRVAGGWVRDKLLGKTSTDIDIALENISGESFAQGLAQFSGINGYGVIKSNPDQSKHLETAVLQLNGLSIDFVALRCESYAETRIPLIMSGTACEDAYRRDLTINALFYNLNTGSVEDFTAFGLYDLEHKIIRTPLNAEKTFKDDPLRILRAFRFAYRFSFKINDSIYAALKNEELRFLVEKKISRERIGIEIKKMISFGRCGPAMVEFVETGFYYSIFKPACFDGGLIKAETVSLYWSLVCGECDRYVVWGGCLEIINLYTVFIFTSGRAKEAIKMGKIGGGNKNVCFGVKKEDEFINSVVCKESLKFTNEFTKKIEKIEICLELFRDENFKTRNCIDFIRILRRMNCYWKLACVFQIAWLRLLRNEIGVETLRNFIDFVEEKEYSEIYSVTCILNGKEIIEELKVNGRRVKEALELGIEYQIEHKETNKEKLLLYLKRIIN